MERFEALSRLILLVERHGDEKDKEAVMVLATLAIPPFPPGAMGAAGGEAAGLTRLFAKTGELGEWQTPPAHSQAMERLIHRLTCLLEAFLDMYEGARIRELSKRLPAAEVAEMVNGPAIVDEFYQTGYCDFCGYELHVDGSCPNCAEDMAT
jgi:hypothetical protein